MASQYKALQIWVKRFSEYLWYLAYEISHRPDSWQGLSHIYLLLFPRFWTFCIKWFAILFLIAWQWKKSIVRSIWLSIGYTTICASNRYILDQIKTIPPFWYSGRKIRQTTTRPETGIRNRNGNGNRKRNRNRKRQRNRDSNVKGNRYNNRDVIVDIIYLIFF